jgi:hypothetical protein
LPATAAVALPPWKLVRKESKGYVVQSIDMRHGGMKGEARRAYFEEPRVRKFAPYGVV